MVKPSLRTSVVLWMVVLLLPMLAYAQQPRRGGPLRNSRLYRGFSNYGVMKIASSLGTSTYIGD